MSIYSALAVDKYKLDIKSLVSNKLNLQNRRVFEYFNINEECT